MAEDRKEYKFGEPELAGQQKEYEHEHEPVNY
jgi:hypothetical protein